MFAARRRMATPRGRQSTCSTRRHGRGGTAARGAPVTSRPTPRRRPPPGPASPRRQARRAPRHAPHACHAAVPTPSCRPFDPPDLGSARRLPPSAGQRSATGITASLHKKFWARSTGRGVTCSMTPTRKTTGKPHPWAPGSSLPLSFCPAALIRGGCCGLAWYGGVAMQRCSSAVVTTAFTTTPHHADVTARWVGNPFDVLHRAQPRG